MRQPLEPEQYTSWAFGRRLRAAGLLGSMGSVGDAFDNAVAESFFGTLQLELLDRQPRWSTRKQLASAIFERSTPERITPRPRWPEGNAVVWQAPDGVVWLFSVVRSGTTWSTSTIVVRTSTDGTKTWSEPGPLTAEAGTMVRSKPIVLAEGDYLLPIYHETGHDPERVGADTTSLFLRYDVGKKRWTESNRIHSRLGNLQPAVAALTDEHLVCYCRRGGNYEPRKDGYIVRSELWSNGYATEMAAAVAKHAFSALALAELVGFTFPDNLRSRRVLEKAGFVYERTFVSDGKPHVLYRLTAGS